jgi:uncharacterized protein with HEPN domain
MLRSADAYLWDVANAIDLIERFCANMSFFEYLENDLVRAGVERQFEIIGEALKQCEANFPGSTASLPNVSAFARFRDRLAHGYFTLDQDVIWRTKMQDIRPMRATLKVLLEGKIPRMIEDPFSDD